jgi:TonB family protein
VRISAFPLLVVATALCLSALTLDVPAVRAQEQPSFDALASEVAASIKSSSKNLLANPTVAVVDFGESYGTQSELGRALAVKFTESLQKQAQGFIVLNRDDLQRAIENHNLPQELLTNVRAIKCYLTDLDAIMSVFIEGDMEYAPDGVVLRVTGWQVKNRRQSIFGFTAIVPMTASMEELKSKPAPSPPLLFTDANRVWLSPEHPPLPDEHVVKMEREENGYTLPRCTKCPNPSFSDNAVYAKMQGTVLLRVQVLADGFPAKISLVRGLPCGLTDKAFEAIERWTFKPATGPDGTPVAADVPLAVTFQLY